MTEASAVRCSSCGGIVRAVPGTPLPACLFCDAPAADLVAVEDLADAEAPEGAIPFVVTAEDAQQAFRAFGGSSFWYPSDLRQARLELRRLLLPAWAWSGGIETHWTGLVSARSPSGKAPRAGAEPASFSQILVPASGTLRLVELSALGRYDESSLAPFDPGAATDPHEVSELSRAAALAAALAEMRSRHEAAIVATHDLVEVRSSAVALQLEGRPVLVPVYIGAYRYGSKTYRVLVNGQSGTLVGDAPTSWWKVFGVVAAVVMVLGGVALMLFLCFGVALM